MYVLIVRCIERNLTWNQMDLSSELIVCEIMSSERSKFIIKKLFELILLCGGIHYTLLQNSWLLFSH